MPAFVAKMSVFEHTDKPAWQNESKKGLGVSQLSMHIQVRPPLKDGVPKNTERKIRLAYFGK